MPIYLGASTKNKKEIIISGKQMAKVYVGAKLVWQKITTFLPSVQVNYIDRITSTSFYVDSWVTGDGGAAVTDRGICYNTTPNPTIGQDGFSGGSGKGEFISYITYLQPNTLYYVRAYAINSNGPVYSDQITVTTAAAISIPVLSGGSYSDITSSSFNATCAITSDGGSAILESGFYYSETFPALSGLKTSDGILGVGTLTSLISGLKPNTLYYVLGYALNAAGIGYIGNGNTITTLPSAVAVPTVIIGGLSNITATQGTCGAIVTNDGGAAVTERGFVYIIQVYPPVMPTMENRLGKIICGTGTGVFSGTLTGLNPDTCYAVRPYAINSAGTGFSAPYNAFNTLKQSTVSVSGVTNTYAYFDMVWRSNYGFITKTGIVINTHANPLSGEVGDKGFLLDYPVPNKMVITGSVSISSLSPNTTYFVRAVYQTASGIYYGEEVTFTTLT